MNGGEVLPLPGTGSLDAGLACARLPAAAGQLRPGLWARGQGRSSPGAVPAAGAAAGVLAGAAAHLHSRAAGAAAAAVSGLRPLCCCGYCFTPTGCRRPSQPLFSRLPPTPCRIGDLAALDMANPSRHYSLNLARPLDRAVAQRLQAAALQEGRGGAGQHLASWRCAKVNGLPLKADALLNLHMYVVPGSGVLRLDYATSKVGGENGMLAGGARLALCSSSLLACLCLCVSAPRSGCRLCRSPRLARSPLQRPPCARCLRGCGPRRRRSAGACCSCGGTTCPTARRALTWSSCRRLPGTLAATGCSNWLQQLVLGDGLTLGEQQACPGPCRGSR
jgi:hypothetical protein